MKDYKVRLLLKVCVLTVMLLKAGMVTAATTSIHKNEISGLLTWTAEDEGFKIELIQLLPDFVRAIYAKHEFPNDELERVAAYCVFGTIIKNTSNQHLSYRVENWQYRAINSNGTYAEALPVKTKTQWLEEWRKAGVTFSWTLLPDVGEFAVGDWQQGFTTIKLARESEFDLLYKWELDGVAHSGTLKNVKCAPESLPVNDEIK